MQLTFEIHGPAVLQHFIVRAVVWVKKYYLCFTEKKIKKCLVSVRYHAQLVNSRAEIKIHCNMVQVRRHAASR